ncbi:MAG: hypothetical protein ABIG63_19910, partial [Chloroflexota bacterium]
QYFREPSPDSMHPISTWCSNSESRNARQDVSGLDACDQHYLRGKKAPLWLRIINKLMKGIRCG